MKNGKSKKFYRRGFLNQSGGTAFFEASSSHLTLSDCNRQITLEFGFYDDKGKRERLKKLDTLISVLTDMRAVMDRREPENEG